MDYLDEDNADVVDCGGATVEDMEVFHKVSFWLEIVIQTCVSIVGIIANFFVIPILCSRRMESIFNRILTLLAVFDNAYLILTVLETLRRNINAVTIFNQIHCHLLHPLRSICMTSTIFLAVALALERYRAIRHPVQYHNANAGINHWRKVFLQYLLPVLVIAVSMGVPRFFEIKTRIITYSKVKVDFRHGRWFVENWTHSEVHPTDVRFNPTYVLVYTNILQFLITGLIPLISLSYLNYRVWSVLHRRRRLQNSFINTTSTALKAEAARQARVLFAVCFVFLIGHAPRLGLNIHEFFVLEDYLTRLKQGCFAVELNTLIAGSVSHVCLAFNSSVNFIIYCFMSREFRRIVVFHVKSLFTNVNALSTGATVTNVNNNHNHARHNNAEESPNAGVVTENIAGPTSIELVPINRVDLDDDDDVDLVVEDYHKTISRNSSPSSSARIST